MKGVISLALSYKVNMWKLAGVFYYKSANKALAVSTPESAPPPLEAPPDTS